MRSVALALLLLGCTDGDSRSHPPPDEPPAGVWEPVPGADIWDASLAVEGDRLWWATTRRITPGGEFLFEESIWLSATSTSGASVIAPMEVAPDSSSMFDPDVVVTPSAVVAKLGGVETLLRRYDRSGTPLGAPYAVEIRGPDITNVNDIVLVPTASGGIQLVASLQADTAEVEIIDIDANGTVGARRLAGTPDTTEPGGSAAGTVSAAQHLDGSTLIAWDRNYNGCVSTKPSATLTTAFDGVTIGAIQPVRDLPDSEASPAIATSGAAAYLVWLSFSGEGSRIALARYPDVATVIAEIGEANQYRTDVTLALAGPDRGAIAWRLHATTDLHVVPFEDRAGTIYVGTPRVIPSVEAEASGFTVGLVHVGDERYVLGWIETRNAGLDQPHRLYATVLDLANQALRPAPPIATTTSPSARPRRLRCP